MTRQKTGNLSALRVLPMASDNDGNLHERFSLAGGVDDDTDATSAWLGTAAKTSALRALVESRAVL